MSSETLRKRLEEAQDDQGRYWLPAINRPGEAPRCVVEGPMLALTAHAPTDLALALDVIEAVQDVAEQGVFAGDLCGRCGECARCRVRIALDAFEALP